MINFPSGTVTFLFTDIEGSTKLAQEYPDAMPVLLARHHEILRQAIQAQNGYIFQNDGDSLAVAFHSPLDALNAALAAQQLLQKELWSPAPIKVRMGIHTGTAKLNDASAATVYTGYTTLATTQRVMSAGHGGQVLLSGATYELVRNSLPTNTALVDLGEKRLKDLLRLEHLYQLNMAGLLASFPPLKTLDVSLTNLPTQLSTFIGREKEVEQIKKRLEKNRLVTLTGSGGVGKTRLSIQVASELLDAYPNGVWLVELAPLTDPTLVTQAVCTALEIKPQGSTPTLDALMDYLRSKKILLVVDNCEHLIDACAQLAETLLHACRDLRMIASSREALGIDGENAYRVPSLSLPDSKSRVDAIGESEAVKLFIKRANAILSEFELTQANAPVVAQICRRLDGIALAIELAAARVKILNVEQISARLDDAFRLLTGGSRTALPRQQTLRALIDWSYNLLSNEERTLLQQLSVFMGGWTLEAAEAVCRNAEMLDLLTHLADKSLVAVDFDHSDETRYYLLETIRQYSREKLFDAGDGKSLRQKHSEWFLSAAERAELRYFNKQDEVRVLNQFENDHENFRTALDWLLATEQFENYARLASSLGIFWFELNYYHEGRHWLGVALDHREHVSNITIARILRILSRILARMGNYELAIMYGEESVALDRELNDKFELAHSTEYLGTVLSENGDEKGSGIYYNEALTLYRELGNKHGISDMMIEIGWGNITAGNFVEGFTILEESLKLKRELGEIWGIAYCLFVFGICRWHSAEYDKSEIASKESMKLFYQLGNKWFMMAGLFSLAGAACARSRPEQAAKIIGVSVKANESIGGMIPPFWLRDVQNPMLDSIRSQIEDSAFNMAWNEGHSMTLEQAIEFALGLANE